MILHFSHIGLTDGRTFMIPFGVGPDEVALVTGTATATMPPERTFAHRTPRGPSATKQNTKRLRRVMSRAVAATIIALQAASGGFSAPAGAAEPVPVARPRGRRAEPRDVGRRLGHPGHARGRAGAGRLRAPRWRAARSASKARRAGAGPRDRQRPRWRTGDAVRADGARSRCTLPAEPGALAPAEHERAIDAFERPCAAHSLLVTGAIATASTSVPEADRLAAPLPLPGRRRL